jgi:hypothetical protein
MKLLFGLYRARRLHSGAIFGGKWHRQCRYAIRLIPEAVHPVRPLQRNDRTFNTRQKR